MTTKKLTIQELRRFYTQDLTWDELVEMASKLNEIAIKMTGFDNPDDRDAGKDAFNFHQAYVKALSAYANGEKVWHVSAMIDPDQYLVAEIDILIHGCHTQTSPVEMYIKGGSVELLDQLSR